MTALVESGCDIVEVGVPYSDPGMDGPTIARATEAALRGGVRVRDTLAAVEAISLAGGRAVVMSTGIRCCATGLMRSRGICVGGGATA